jgi:peptidoglycan-N-acetylglucosamine deacetylase
MKHCLFTADVETTSIWFNALLDETGLKVVREGMPLLLDIYRRHGIQTTFFFTGYIARLYPEVVRMVLQDGHEVGSHGKSHLPENGFDVMAYERQKQHLEYSKKLLEDISGQEVISFRAPALRVGEDTARALVETGYRIDSSVASQRFDFFLSFGGFKKLRWLSAPRNPYRTSVDSIFKKGAGPVVEVPLSAFFLPYVGTTMRIFPRVTSMQRWGFHWEAGLTGKPVVFDIHPNEFLDESAEARVVHRRSRNPVTYLLKDVVRSRLKVKNLGPKAAPLYEKEIVFYKERGYRFTTLRDYCEETGLLRE